MSHLKLLGLTPKLSVTLRSRLSSTRKWDSWCYKKPGKTRKLQGRRLEREKKENEETRRGRELSQDPDAPGLGTLHTTPDLLASPSTHHSLRILAQGNRYLFNRKEPTPTPGYSGNKAPPTAGL